MNVKRMTDTIIIRQPTIEKEFAEMYDLRWRILRKPWNQPVGSEKDEREEDSYHFIAILNNKIVGTARLQENEEINGKREGQIRYLAVEEEYQNKKIGRDLLAFIDWFAKNKKIAYIQINARKTASEFFIKQGYNILKEGPKLFGEIEHYVMRKEFKQKIFYF